MVSLNQCSTRFILGKVAVNSHIIILTNGPDKPGDWAGDRGGKNLMCLCDWPELEQTSSPDPKKTGRKNVICSFPCLYMLHTCSKVHRKCCWYTTKCVRMWFNISHKVRAIFGSVHLFFLSCVMTAVIILHQRMSLVGDSPIFHCTLKIKCERFHLKTFSCEL